MNQDINSRADIELLVNTFYNQVKKDDILKKFFKNVSWEKHLQVMYDFWENAIFYSGVYAGNPMNVHSSLNKKMPLSADAFRRWTELFTVTVDKLFSGANANLIKQRAVSIATVMQIKILQPEVKKHD
jgi:hemoglobin